MTKIDKMVAEALKRLQAHINRSAGQQKRQMVAAWRKKNERT
jgi:hypothetical protein